MIVVVRQDAKYVRKDISILVVAIHVGMSFLRKTWDVIAAVLTVVGTALAVIGIAEGDIGLICVGLAFVWLSLLGHLNRGKR